MNGRNDKPSQPPLSYKFEVSKTAKPVTAVKYVTAQPSFWQTKGCGKRDTPLTKNECSTLFLTNEDIKKAEQRPDLDTIKTVSTRERWLNKLYENYIKNGCQQIVILGSGFDIRPFKKNADNQQNKKHAKIYSKVKFWEVDKPEILDEKEQTFKSKNLDKNATYIRADYTKENFVEMLIANGLNPNAPTLFIWEGNLMYLEKSEALNVIKKLKDAFTDFSIGLDYFTQSFIDALDSKSPLKQMWKTGIDDIREFAEQLGLVVEKNQNFRDLQTEYDVDNNPPKGTEEYSMCSLRKLR